MEHYQPPVLHSVREVASSDRGEYTVVQHGSKPAKRHVYSVLVTTNPTKIGVYHARVLLH